MNVADFIAKWRQVELTERSAAQQHFLDLCELLEHPKPAAVDPHGEAFTFERGASKESGGEGWADVWKRGFFGWEYKGRHKDLEAAYQQLLQYRAALENPPLLIVCDFERIVIRTNFTATKSETFAISLAKLAEPRNLEILRYAFFSPEKLRPVVTSEVLTAEAARRFGDLAQALRQRGCDPLQTARFLDCLIFCFFAENIGILSVPDGETDARRLLSYALTRHRRKPARFRQVLEGLFAVMAKGGCYGLDDVLYFNGDLFAASAVLDLSFDELQELHKLCKLDWSKIEPSIFGTLFERGLDPAKRSQIGAHYTGGEDIATLIDPVVMAPLRREWDEVRRLVGNLLAWGRKEAPAGGPAKPLAKAQASKARGEATAIVQRFLHRLRHVTVLDPACGSGNFLYVALRRLKDFEREVIAHGSELGLGIDHLPLVGPHQMYGLELNPYAHQLAQLAVWIGHLQWMHSYGYGIPEPVLQSLAGNFQCRDAILDLTPKCEPREPEWPKVDFIVGNPPFLGDKLMRAGLGNAYVDRLRALYRDRIPGQADLCCYWYERARAEIAAGRCWRAGLLATQGIRNPANRQVLERIKETGDIFFAISDQEWLLAGASVHIAIVAFDNGEDKERSVDGQRVKSISTVLSSVPDVTKRRKLRENEGMSFLGSCKGGPFDITLAEARELLQAPANPSGVLNSDIIRPVMNSRDMLGRGPSRWIIDTSDRTLEDACQYEVPFQLVKSRVKPQRDSNRDQWLKANWWRPQRMRPEMRQCVARLSQPIVTPTTSKHRIFIRLDSCILPDHQLIVFPREDDYFLGVLHSRWHELWARAQGTQLRERESGFRYTPTTCFETFPLPWRPGSEPWDDPRIQAISPIVEKLERWRQAWLNPPEWTVPEVLEFCASANGPWARYVESPDARGTGTVRYTRLVPRDAACAESLAKRTLTALYNSDPAWLRDLHEQLDAAVAAAYGWPADLSPDQALQRLLALNRERAGA